VFIEDEVVEPAGREDWNERLLDTGARALDCRFEVSSWRLIASGPFDVMGPRATTRTVTGGIGFSPGTRKSVPARSISA
jgi:hypothetical protein